MNISNMDASSSASLAANASSAAKTGSETSKDNLASKLESGGLNPKKWLKHFEKECGVTDQIQLKFLGPSELKKLQKHVNPEWEWEQKALVKAFHEYTKELGDKNEAGEDQMNKIKERYSGLGKDGDQHKGKDKFKIKDKNWSKESENKTIDSVIQDIGGDSAEKAGTDTVDRKGEELTPHELLRTASGGLALKGLLLTNQPQHFEPCKTVIKVPKDVKFKSEKSPQIDDTVEFTSHTQADRFSKYLDTLGRSAAVSANGEALVFEAEVGFSISNDKTDKEKSESHEDVAYLSRIRYSYVPTAVCELDKRELKISESLIEELCELERLIQATDNVKVIQEKCEAILREYGSHVNTGDIEFGGMYQWKATYDSKTTSQKQEVKDMVHKALSGYVSVSFSIPIVPGGFAIGGQHVQTQSTVDASFDKSKESNVNLNTSKIGGPLETTSLSQWKSILISHNNTWRIMDRSTKSADFVGLWDLIRNNLNEFTDGRKLADTLQRAWQAMNGIASETHPRIDIVDAIHLMDDIVSHVQIWNTEDEADFANNAAHHLQELMDGARECCSITGDTKLWVKKLRSDQTVYDFLKHIMDLKESYSAFHLGRVREYLNEIIEGAKGQEFALKDVMHEWLLGRPGELEHSMSMMGDQKLDDIPSLMKAIREKLLCGHTGGDSGNKINVKATTELASAVKHLCSHFQKTDQHYEHFLLLVTLLELRFDSERNVFEVCLTQHGMADFVQKCEAVWADFTCYRDTKSLNAFQAFLVRFLVVSLLETQNQRNREPLLSRFIDIIRDLLTSDMQMVLEEVTDMSPLQTTSLIDTLNNLKQGQKYVPKPSTFRILDFDDAPSSEQQQSSVKKPNMSVPADLVPDETTDAGNILRQFGLTKYYPAKISLQDVIAVRDLRYVVSSHSDVPWVMLHKLITLDHRGRETGLSGITPQPEDTWTSDSAAHQKEGLTIDSIFGNILSAGHDEKIVNPLDVFIVVYACCDLILKQVLLQKMFLCRIAVPFISPQLMDGKLLYSHWAFQSILLNWKNKRQVCFEKSAVKQPVKTVSFLNVGKPSFSKSILLNNVISDQAHHIFWNRECPSGTSELSVANGLVEAQWYLPEGKETDAFNDVTMFLNLRGDACDHRRQVNFLSKMSNVVVCCLEPIDLDKPEVLETMKKIHTSSAKVILFFYVQDASLSKMKEVDRKLQMYNKYIGTTNMSNTILMSSLREMKIRTPGQLKEDFRKGISELLSGQEGKSINQNCTLAEATGIEIDEDEHYCKIAKEFADEVMSCLENKSASDCKVDLLPLQGKMLEEWSKLLKEGNRSMTIHPISDRVNELKLGPLHERLKEIRNNQLEKCKRFSPLLKVFHENLLKVVDTPAAALYMQWLKLHFDELSRATLPRLQLEYDRKRRELAALKGHNDLSQINKSRDDLLSAEKKLTEASLGVEHLLREVAQLYEASQESEKQLGKKTGEVIGHLPKVAAKLLLQGQHIEIMDGDAANVPLTWVKAVFSSLANLVGDKRVFTISVAGIQSSGKSALLNTMFGLQFVESAGRCTRGVDMQLIRVDRERSVLPYDYVLVLDTEGLRAQELGQLMHEHDNQLATFVIGVSDVTILNIQGENVSEIADVLQIAVHAFLRMKLSKSRKHTCVFVHHNVPAQNAQQKTKYGRQKNLDTLDEMTAEACAAENIVHICTFNEVIEFDIENSVWHIPKAPVSVEYTQKVQEVANFILNSLSKTQKRFLTFSDMSAHMEDLWKAVLAENFVFSFKNSLAARLYNSLERIYHEKSWMVQNGLTEWVIQTAFVQLEKCTTLEELKKCHVQLLGDVEKKGSTLKATAQSDLQEFFNNQNPTALLVEWKTEKLLSLTHETNQFLIEAATDIDDKKFSVSVDLLQVQRQEEQEIELMNKAKALASEMRGKSANEETLNNIFKDFSHEWSRKLTAKIPTSRLHCIEPNVQRILRKRLRHERSLTVELQNTPLAEIPAYCKLEFDDIEDTHMSINISVMRTTGERAVGVGVPETRNKCRHKAVNAVNSILKKVSKYLSDTEKEQAGFKNTYASNIINIVAEGVQMHNQTSKDSFTMTRELMVKVAVHACRYALPIFIRMQKEYEESHSVEKKIDRFNAAYLSFFKNTVYQKANEVIAADLLKHQLVVFLENAVAKVMSAKVVNEILREFGFQKYSLLIKILDDLTERGFHDYLEYISNPRRFALKWLTTFTDKTIFAVRYGKSRYVRLAEGHLHTLLKSVKSSIRAAADAVRSEEPPTIRTWVKQFCASLTALSVNEHNLKLIMEQDVRDFTNFTELLGKGLPELEKSVLSFFEAQLAEIVPWEGDPPYEGILDKLWGCEAQCPLCDEICQKTTANHHLSESDSHTCIQHRPSAVGGTNWNGRSSWWPGFIRNRLPDRSGQLALENCNFDVQSKFAHDCGVCRFECKKGGCSGSTDHLYQDYKSYMPDWDIAPSSSIDSSKYWMWFVATYKHELAEHYKAKEPDVPASWRQITKQQARASLRVVSN